jgi:OOP family OmpA-OmpF porin
MPQPAPRNPELHPVYFALDSFVLDARSQQTLDAAVATMRDHDDLVIEVGGYTCTIGTEEYKMQLSQRRAQAVLEYLAGRGVPRNRMMLRAYGEMDPIADNSTDAGRRMNRRVELVILDR